MSDVRKVNVGRVLDKIQSAAEEFAIDDDVQLDVADTDDLQRVFAEYGAAGLQTIVRGRRGDGEVEIRYNNHGMPGVLLLNASGTLTDVSSQSETNVDSVVAQLLIAALFGEKELPAEDGFTEDPQWRGAAAYAKCLLASSKSGCRSVLNKWKGLTDVAVAESQRGEAAAQVSQQIANYKNYVRQALALVDTVRQKAKERDAWYNKITPKEVSVVLGRHQPAIDRPAGVTDLDKAANSYQAAYAMLAELFRTKTGKALFWDVAGSSPFECTTSDYYRESCDRSGYTADYVETCSIAGITQARDRSESSGCVNDPPPPQCHGKSCGDF